MDLLHGTVATTLIEEIRRYKSAGEPIPASVLAQCIKFLKDNGIDRAVRVGDNEDLLAKELSECDLPEGHHWN